MRIDLRTSLFIAAVALPANLVTAYAVSNVSSNGLASVDSFSSISDPAQRSAAYFTELGKVLTNPRCLNCHPAGDRPRQGDAARPHQPPVARGVDGFGLPAMRCPICHQAANFEPGRVPGDPIWHLAPREIGLGRQDARRDLRPDQGSSAERRPAAGSPRTISEEIIWSAGRGRRGSAANRRTARKKKRARWSTPG
jgi:hypothetical protein